MHLSISALFAGFFLLFTACGNSSKDQKETTTKSDTTTAVNNGLVIVESSKSVDETYQNLVDAIERNEALSIIAELNHQENAASVNMELRPTRVLMFGNPRLGTPLMQSSQTAGIDLPQKFLVYEDAQGQVFVAYNKPSYITSRHQIEGNERISNKIADALQTMAEAAADVDEN